jgi:hypothetical protein
MGSTYYINAESGDRIRGRTVHEVRECADSAGDGCAHPIGDSHVDAESDYCPDCTDAAESDLCEAVKSDGEVCGRSRPCRYHDS